MMFCAAQASGQLRHAISLNADAATGTWTFTPIAAYDRDNASTGPKTVVTIAPGPITVPSFWSDHNPDWDDDWRPITNPHNKWIEQAEYTRRFDIPATWAGQRIKLHFGAVNHACEVRVNGQLAGPKHIQGTVPFEFDITDLVRPGSTDNAINVMVWDHNGVREPTDMSRYAAPIGHAIWAHKMSGISQDVTLRALPSVYVKDAYVVTSVSTMTITLELTIANEDAVAHTIRVENDLRRITQLTPTETSRLERSLNAPNAVTINPGQEVVVTVSDAWPDATLWWPHSPQLYRLRTRLIESSTTIDEKNDVRFGFREFTIDPATGNRYNLNGLPFRGRGATINVMNGNLYGHRQAIEYVIDTYKAFGAVLIRHGAAVPPPPVFWDVCDEKGMLAIEEFYYNGQNENESGKPWVNGFMFYTLNYGHPTFEQRVDAMAQALVRRDRNHPSIVIWNIENEVFYNLLADQATEQQKDDIARVRTVIEQLDATRPIGCDHEGTLNGRLAIKNKHYPCKPANLNDEFRAKGWGDFYSDNIYWPMAADPPRVPFGVGEFHWLKNASDDIKDITCPTNWGRHRAYAVRGFRLFGASDIRTFSYTHDALRLTWAGHATRNSHMINRKSLAAVAVFDHDYDTRDVRLDWAAVDEGSTNTRRYDVYNDDIIDPSTSITVNWQVRLLDGVVDAGSTTVDVPLADTRSMNLTWTAPTVATDTNFIVTVEAAKSGKQRFTDYRIFRAIDRDGVGPTVSTTFREDFDGGPTKGMIEYDTFWTIANGIYTQPEPRGIYPGATPTRKQATGKWAWRSNIYGTNAHMSAIHPWTFSDARIAFDLAITDFRPGTPNQWAGMGLRMTHPESSPYEPDKSRRSGYTIGLRRLAQSDRNASRNSNWQLFIARVNPATQSLQFLASKQVPVPTGFVRVEAEMIGSKLTASALSEHVTATDTAYTTGFAGLVTSPHVAVAYDNLQIGSAPFAPAITVPPTVEFGPPLTVTWTAPPDATQYLVQCSPDGFKTVGATSGWTSSTTWDVADLPPGLIALRAFSRDASGQQSVSSPLVWTAIAPMGDLDGDFDVDVADFTLLVAAFSGPGRTTANPTADLDRDTDCDLDDMTIMTRIMIGP